MGKSEITPVSGKKKQNTARKEFLVPFDVPAKGRNVKMRGQRLDPVLRDRRAQA